jgi:DNA-binding NarL/FixJ family response regulator
MTEPVRPVRVLLAADQPLLRAGLRMALTADDAVDVVGEAGDGVAAVELTRRRLPDVVVMRLRMPRLDGVLATRGIVAAGLPVRVLALAGRDADEEAIDALRAGASGVLVEDSTATDLVRTIQAMTGGQAVLTPPVLRSLLDRSADRPPEPVPSAVAEVLTGREREVLTYLARGLCNAEISQALSVGETTVKTHVGRILAKLGLRDRVQAVVLAYESGLIHPGRTVGPGFPGSRDG